MVEITISFGILVGLLAIIVGCVAFFRSRPGYRRRRPDPEYSGPPRRCTDSETGEPSLPTNGNDTADKRDMIDLSNEHEGKK